MQMIGDDVFCLLEPPSRELIEHLSLVWDFGENAVKRGESVRGDDESFAVGQVIPLADFACLLVGKGKVCFAKCLRE
jgi:hypothetical protein